MPSVTILGWERLSTHLLQEAKYSFQIKLSRFLLANTPNQGSGFCDRKVVEEQTQLGATEKAALTWAQEPNAAICHRAGHLLNDFNQTLESRSEHVRRKRTDARKPQFDITRARQRIGTSIDCILQSELQKRLSIHLFWSPHRNFGACDSSRPRRKASLPSKTPTEPCSASGHGGARRPTRFSRSGLIEDQAIPARFSYQKREDICPWLERSLGTCRNRQDNKRRSGDRGCGIQSFGRAARIRCCNRFNLRTRAVATNPPNRWLPVSGRAGDEKAKSMQMGAPCRLSTSFQAAFALLLAF